MILRTPVEKNASLTILFHNLLIIVFIMPVFNKFVFSQSITCCTKLITNVTLISRGIYMVGFNMDINVCFHF